MTRGACGAFGTDLWLNLFLSFASFVVHFLAVMAPVDRWRLKRSPFLVASADCAALIRPTSLFADDALESDSNHFFINKPVEMVVARARHRYQRRSAKEKDFNTKDTKDTKKKEV